MKQRTLNADEVCTVPYEEPELFKLASAIKTAGVEKSSSFTLAWLRLILAAVVLPNLITCAASASFVSFFRGWINIECVLIIAAYAVTQRRILLLVLSAELLVDLFEPVAHVYYFSPRDAFDALSYINTLPWWTIAVYTASVFGYFAFVITGVKLLVPVRGRLSAASVAVVSLSIVSGLFAADLFQGRYQVLGADMTKIHSNLVRTPALSIAYRAFSSLGRKQSARPMAIEGASIKYLRAEQVAFITARTNLVIVLVESWGQANDNAVAVDLDRPYASAKLAARYKVDFGMVPFRGPTVFGESRELCGDTFEGGISAASDKDLKGCLPNVFAAKGYSTIGVHGFYPRVYDRFRWYPRIGFSETVFKPDFDKLGMKTCPGGLVGTCDSEVADWITNRLRQSSPAHPVFIHWVTLNSHLPVAEVVSPGEKNYCEALSPVLKDRALCNWYTLIKRVHQSVERIASDNSLPPTAFVIVGDHAPPFSSTMRRNEFSQKEVPYVLLTPKSDSTK